MQKIPFNRPFIIGKELQYIAQAVEYGQLAGDGMFTKKCHKWLENKLNIKKVFLTTSCTSALEMAAILSNVKEGDEIIMPSFTFVSTANAFVLRNAKPVFVDIKPETLNINENLIEEAVTEKTKAIVPVHYAGVSCEMDKIINIAKKYNLFVIEDAAQSLMSGYKSKSLGTIGDLGCFSFHETKNFISGEGGAIAINNEKFIERAEIIREKGTNRSQYFRGEIDKYTWLDIGSSFLPSEIIAAFLYAQLEEADKIISKRKKLYDYYFSNLKSLQNNGIILLPYIPEDCTFNAHMFYVLLENNKTRNNLMEYLNNNNINAVFHYLPLHTSKMGKNFGFKKYDFPVTEDISGRLLRLPFYFELERFDQDRIIDTIFSFFH